MPILNVTLSGAPDAERAQRVATTLTALTAQHLGKDPGLTAVAVSHVAPEHWFAGGASLAAQARTSFFLSVLVSDETNTAGQKRAYIGAVYAAMAELLGPLHELSYIHVHDARTAAWGYGGQTQQLRAVRQLLA